MTAEGWGPGSHVQRKQASKLPPRPRGALTLEILADRNVCVLVLALIQVAADEQEAQLGAAGPGAEREG